MNRTTARWVIAAAALALAGCIDGGGLVDRPSEANEPDTGGDAAVIADGVAGSDAGASDGGSSDTAPKDAASADPGTDAAPFDTPADPGAGTDVVAEAGGDGGPLDTGSADAGPADSGPIDVAPDAAPTEVGPVDAAPEVAADAAADAAPETTADAAADTAPEVAVDVAPEVAVDAAPEVAADTAVDIPPETAADAAADIAADVPPACEPTVPPVESCDGKDNDCDGQTDEATCAGGACATAACLPVPGGPGFACALFAKEGPCDDGEACTSGDACKGGVCAAGVAKACDDGNACTADACKGGVCQYVAVVGACDDGDLCTASDTCDGGACKAGQAMACNDGNGCTSDSCDPTSGKCVFAPIAGCGGCTVGGAGCAKGHYCAGAPGVCKGAGTCTAMPGACPLYYKPVCGCNGVTYGNSCEAAAAGVTVLADGACAPPPQPCGGLLAVVCPKGQVCDLTGCGADQKGLCAPAPVDPCPKTTVDAQECGCDGVTYANSCLRLLAGVAKKAAGACPVAACAVGDQKVCGALAWCKGTCGGKGLCTAKPTVCPKLWAPVCGCDGLTYGNDCLAALAGQSVSYAGACKPVGCTSSVDCDDGKACTIDACDATTGVCKNTAIAGCTGPCAAGQSCDDGNACTADVCTKLGVCISTALDGTCSDGNACTAPDTCVGGACKAGAPKLCDDGNPCTTDSCDPATGACVSKPAPDCAGCTVGNNATCPKGHYCKGAAGVCGGAGSCAPMPTICPDLYQPVCGCNGMTYGNSCDAAAAGVAVAALGECKAKVCGGFLGVPCAKGEVCDVTGCGADLQGVCVPAPVEPCPKTTADAQECGCDGKTYANSCFRLLAGVAKKAAGACPITTACAVGDPTACGASGFCKGACGGKGVCTAKPAACLGLYAPACGCDNKTYSNECVANSAGQVVQYSGACKVAGCSATVVCNDGNACTKDACDAATGKCVFTPVADCTGAACPIGNPTACGTTFYCAAPKVGVCSGTGACAVKPKICPLALIPTCGCDNVTYGNPCEAAAAGMNVHYAGSCKATP